ncbi:hypothetical protein, partial [Massilia aurea]|uniref:hypothetical protein n=1 Tax=Massilia aurea TaxID=373040 RepID=UPI001C82F6FA
MGKRARKDVVFHHRQQVFRLLKDGADVLIRPASPNVGSRKLLPPAVQKKQKTARCLHQRGPYKNTSLPSPRLRAFSFWAAVPRTLVERVDGGAV